MPGKQVQCPTCSKTMRSDNLKLHRNVCLTRHQKTARYSGIHQAKSNVESESDSVLVVVVQIKTRVHHQTEIQIQNH